MPATSKQNTAIQAQIRAWMLIAGFFLAPACLADGKLLMVGGALDKDNGAVHRAFISSALSEGPVVIIPAASGRPSRAANGFADELSHYGLDRERLHIYPLAVKDDSETVDVDESQWAENAWSEQQVEAVRHAAAVWFTGGDQVRITQSLMNEAGEESPLLKVLRERLAAGAVIGGTSAGTAIMSGDMIAGGISFHALLEPLAKSYSSIEDQDSGRLSITRGLGFLPTGIVDQHFDRKARLGRLVRAMAATDQKRAYGIDENTGLLLDLETGNARVVGAGTVTILDASHAQFDFDSSDLVRKLELSVIAAGVTFHLADLEFTSGQGKPTVGHEYFNYPPMQGGGMALANPRLDQMLGHDLMDNGKSTRLERYTLGQDGRLLIYTFSQTRKSRGFWRSEGSGDRYSVSRVRFDVSRHKVNPG